MPVSPVQQSALSLESVLGVPPDDSPLVLRLAHHLESPLLLLFPQSLPESQHLTLPSHLHLPLYLLLFDLFGYFLQIWFAA